MDERNASFSHFMELMYAAAQIMSRHSQPCRYGTDDELHFNEVHTLKYICDHPGVSSGSLGACTYRSKGAASMMIGKLVEKGMVEKRYITEDVRRCALYPTEKGALVDSRHRDFDQLLYEEILADLPDTSQEDVQRAGVILEALVRHHLDSNEA